MADVIYAPVGTAYQGEVLNTFPGMEEAHAFAQGLLSENALAGVVGDKEGYHVVPDIHVARTLLGIDEVRQNPRNPSKFDRCVKKVRARGQALNEYAVCTAAGTRNPARHRLEGWGAIQYAERHGISHLNKYADPVSGAGRVTIEKAKKVAADDPQLIYLYVRAGNPQAEAADLSEKFHGRPSEQVVEVEERVHYHDDLAMLGDLVELHVETESGYECDIAFEDPMPYLAASEDGSSLYIAGGNQSLDLKGLHMDGPKWKKDLMVIGRIKSLVYFTRKEQDNFEGSEYEHKSREGLNSEGTRHKIVSEVDPILLYDTKSKLLAFAGGQMNLYQPEVGIVG